MIDNSDAGSWEEALAKPKQSERMVQRAIRSYLSANGFISAHVPNGAVLAGGPAKRARQMAALKGDGFMIGFPDLIVFSRSLILGFWR